MRMINLFKPSIQIGRLMLVAILLSSTSVIAGPLEIEQALYSVSHFNSYASGEMNHFANGLVIKSGAKISFQESSFYSTATNQATTWVLTMPSSASVGAVNVVLRKDNEVVLYGYCGNSNATSNYVCGLSQILNSNTIDPYQSPFLLQEIPSMGLTSIMLKPGRYRVELLNAVGEVTAVYRFLGMDPFQTLNQF